MTDPDIIVSSKTDRVAWRRKALGYVASLAEPKAFDGAEACGLVDMTWHKAHQEGLEDAIMLLLDLAADKPRAERELIRSLADTIEALRAKNDADMRALRNVPAYRPDVM